MTLSMTGFAARKGQGLGHSWAWDIRSVNGKGLDLRLRVPDWIEGLEAAVRAALGGAIHRGNVSLNLRLSRDSAAEGGEAFRLNLPTLQVALRAVAEAEAAAQIAGVTLAATSAADLMGLRGVLDIATAEVDGAALRGLILADLPGLLQDFHSMRAGEGAALHAIVAGQLTVIADLLEQAATEAAARRDTAAHSLREAVDKLLAATEAVDAGRLAQELALLAVKTDVQEELDRLSAHVAAARSLLAEPGAVGRKFDFLMQEFMREANTLCSKAQSLALTRIGLDLKTTIDQMREQVQNVE